MALKKDNIKSLFSNTRSRIIIVFTVILLVITISVGFVKFNHSLNPLSGSSDVRNTPGGIQSIPGALNQTAQYAALQEQQNEQQAQKAAATGTSSIPTIIRSQAFGQGVQSVGAVGGQGSVGFATLARENLGGPQSTLWFQNLKEKSCSKESIDSAVNQNNASMSDLHLACTCSQLKAAGYGLSDLKSICSCIELKNIGFDIKQFKAQGYSAKELRSCGFVACQEHAANFTAVEMKNAGFSDGELKGAGFSDADIARAGGLPDGVSVADVQKAGCSIENMKRLKASGVTAAAIRRITGCSVGQMMAASYSAEDLNKAGFSAAELKKAGFTPEQLRVAGFSARDLLNAGFTPEALTSAGFSQSDIGAAESSLPPGISMNDVSSAGCINDQLKCERPAGVSATMIKNLAHCNAPQLLQGGFSHNDLVRTGFNSSDLKLATSVSDMDVTAAGCDPAKLQALVAQGATEKQINSLNCSVAVLNQLKNKTVSPPTVACAIAAGRSADCSADSLIAAHGLGVSAETIKKTLGCSSDAMHKANFSALELKDAGFTAAELKNAGFTPADLKGVGFTAKELHAAGISAAALKAVGFDAAALKDAGVNATELKDAGFTPEQSKAAGFSAEELKTAGFTATALRKAGYPAKELKEAGFSVVQMKNAGFTEGDLSSAGVSAQDSALAGLETISPLAPTQSNLTTIPSIAGTGATNQQKATAEADNAKQLQIIMNRQHAQQVDQRFQQSIQQRTAQMIAAANQIMQPWKTVTTQQYLASSAKEDKATNNSKIIGIGKDGLPIFASNESEAESSTLPIVKMGDVLFAVIDTSVNSDEPGPILATIVSGSLKGGKLIGTFNLPKNAEKMVISFNSLSMPGAPKAISISAFAVDPNTARTALSSETDHHYLMRYGSLFASTFLEGFGNAFQSADTTITVGGTGGVTNTTVQNGIGRSTLENAVIGLATVGKAWGQVAQQNMSRPTTVQVYSGTAVGVLFTQDLKT